MWPNNLIFGKKFPADGSSPPTLEKFYQDVPVHAATLGQAAKPVNPNPRVPK